MLRSNPERLNDTEAETLQQWGVSLLSIFFNQLTELFCFGQIEKKPSQ